MHRRGSCRFSQREKMTRHDAGVACSLIRSEDVTSPSRNDLADLADFAFSARQVSRQFPRRKTGSRTRARSHLPGIPGYCAIASQRNEGGGEKKKKQKKKRDHANSNAVNDKVSRVHSREHEASSRAKLELRTAPGLRFSFAPLVKFVTRFARGRIQFSR